jgi:hypothetical protein
VLANRGAILSFLTISLIVYFLVICLGATAAPPVSQKAAPPAVSAEATTGGPTSPASSAPQPTSPSYSTTPRNQPASPLYQSAASPPSQPVSPSKEAAVHFTGQTPQSPSHRRIGTPQRGSSIRIKNVQEATQAVAQSKYRESLGMLEVGSKNFSNKSSLYVYLL